MSNPASVSPLDSDIARTPSLLGMLLGKEQRDQEQADVDLVSELGLSPPSTHPQAKSFHCLHLSVHPRGRIVPPTSSSCLETWVRSCL